MKLLTEQPHLRLMCRNGTFCCFPVAQLDAVRETWMAGRAFYHGADLWGDPCWVKLADVVGLCHRTEEGFALVAEDEAERKRRELVDGPA